MANRSTSTETKEPGDATKRDGMTHHNRPAVQSFLDRFATAMTSGNSKAVAELWEAPAFVIDDRATIAVPDLDAVVRFFAGAKDQYNAKGIIKTKAEIVHSQAQQRRRVQAPRRPDARCRTSDAAWRTRQELTSPRRWPAFGVARARDP